MIYADWAATSGRLAEGVLETVSDYLQAPNNPGHSTSLPARNTGREIWKTRVLLSDLFSLQVPERVIFTSGITESLNLAIRSLFHEGDAIITSYLEHNSVLRPLYQTGASLTFTNGTLEEIMEAWKPETKAVVLTHVSNVTGEIQDLEAIGQWAKKKHLLFLVDAAQSAGILPIDMQKMHIDLLAITGHKGLQGLQGIGALLVKEGIELEPLKTGGSGILSFEKTMPAAWPEHLEAGTLNIPGILSLQAAGKRCQKNRAQKEEKIRRLSRRFYEGIREEKKIHLYRNPEKDALGVFSLNIEGIDPAYAADVLERTGGICCRTGAHCAPLVLEHYGIKSCMRFSFGPDNTEEEIDQIVQGLRELACA